jgi:hypothetical protein
MNYLVKTTNNFNSTDLKGCLEKKFIGDFDVSEFTGFPITEGMREEVSKKVNAHCDDGCSTCKYKQFNDCGTRLTLDILSQMQSQQQLPMVKTGVLELPHNKGELMNYAIETLKIELYRLKQALKIARAHEIEIMQNLSCTDEIKSQISELEQAIEKLKEGE